MKDNSVLRLGGAMAILIGSSELFASVGYLFLPPSCARLQRAGFLPAYAANPGLLNSIFWSEVIVGIFGLQWCQLWLRWCTGRSEGWTRGRQPWQLAVL